MHTMLFGFPYAGGGASFYRSWPVQPGFTVHGVQLPGREECFDEPWPLSLPDTVAFAAEQVTGRCTPDDRIALFGHSFGALMAYEVARCLLGHGYRPVHLFASGSLDPTTPLGRDPAPLTDDEFVARVEHLAGYRHPALDIPDLRDLVLPVLREDVQMHETYRDTGESPLPVPITAIRGTADHIVGAEDCERWGKVTTAGCSVVELPGGHMYLVDDALPLLRAIRTTLRT
ncbi:thioesterase II family protein [Amycolatopsis sp. lyj-346]|uniref:thioesterase II family protein n=1 Tax=Amycolatopsis sp. lyj-346 TaxID=2789289 RepID=UPI00397AD38F